MIQKEKLRSYKLFMQMILLVLPINVIFEGTINEKTENEQASYEDIFTGKH